MATISEVLLGLERCCSILRCRSRFGKVGKLPRLFLSIVAIPSERLEISQTISFQYRVSDNNSRMTCAVIVISTLGFGLGSGRP